MAAKTTSEYAAFEELWEQANARQEALQVAQIDEPDTNVTPGSLLRRLSSLADALAVADAIDGDQHGRMKAAVHTLEEVIETVDPDAMAAALKRVNSQPLPAQ